LTMFSRKCLTGRFGELKLLFGLGPKLLQLLLLTLFLGGYNLPVPGA